MLKSEFATGLMKETKDSLASQIAMWDDLSLWSVIWQKTKGIIIGYDALKYRLDNHIEQLNSFNPDSLRLMIIFRLCKYLKIQLPKEVSVGDIDDIGQKIEIKAISLLKQTDKNFKGNNTRDMASYILRRMFDDLSKRFADQDPETQSKIVQEIMDSLKSMPEEQRERLKKELKVEELTEDAVRKAIIAGSLGAAFAVVIDVAGFSAYIFAVKALACMASLVGITLPFAAYTTLTSIIAVLANPLFLIPAIFGLGRWFTKKNNSKIQNGLVPVIVTQAVVSSVINSPIDTTIKSFLERYKKLVKEYKKSNFYKRIKLRKKFPGIKNII